MDQWRMRSCRCVPDLSRSRWTDDQPDTFAAGSLLPHKGFARVQGSLDLPDVAHVPATRPPQGPHGPQGLEGADSEPGNEAAIGSPQGGCGQPARTPAPGRCAPVSRMAATSTARKIRNSRSSTSSSIQAITPPRLFPRLLMYPARQRRGTCPAAPARSPGAAPLHLEPGHLVSATAASAAEANNCRRADLAVIHPRCCHSRSASESPAITTSPNGMER